METTKKGHGKLGKTLHKVSDTKQHVSSVELEVFNFKRGYF